MRQFVRFLIVGAGNTTISFVVYRLLLAVDVPYPAAALLAFAAGAANGYVFNRIWTFAARDTTRSRLLYVLIAATGAVAMSLVVVLCVRVFGLGRVEGYLVAIPPVTVGTFLANRLWTFRDGRRLAT